MARNERQEDRKEEEKEKKNQLVDSAGMINRRRRRLSLMGKARVVPFWYRWYRRDRAVIISGYRT